MQNSTVRLSTASSRLQEVRHTREAANCPHQCAFDFHPDTQFVTMLNAYRASGGLARAQEVVALFKRCEGPTVATLTQWIVQRDVICFDWRAQAWLPMFQFDRLHLQPDIKLKPVFSELAGTYGQWELATWFAEPNPWLESHAPVDMLLTDMPAVLNAARAERFIAQV